MSIKKALLLSAGFGTRLRPITNTVPKCLVPINGKPLLAYWLEQLSEAGIEEFVINTHYLAAQVQEFVEQSPYKNKITLVHEPELLGTLGTVKNAQHFWQGENILVAHADNLVFCDWNAFFSAFLQRPKGCTSTMMLFETDTPQSCGIVDLDNEERVTGFYEKVANPPSNLANGAIYIFDDTLADQLLSIESEASDISIDLMPSLLGKMNSWKNLNYLRDIGNVESLAIANQYVLQLQTGVATNE